MKLLAHNKNKEAVREKAHKKRYRNALLAFMFVLVAFLIVVDFVIINYQQNTTLNFVRHHLMHEMEMMGLSLRESMLNDRYDKAKDLMLEWAKAEKRLWS